jgi:predicted DsbA family dithiol-disulfide isomerase
MKIEIWSDIMCPFCYIGKRKFEMALQSFPHKSDVEVEWKSFQLNPDLKTNPDKKVHEYLAEAKGWSLEHTKEMNVHVSQIAEAVGLKYNLEDAVIANSFDAHRFLHLAKKLGLQNEAEERLFEAYFTEGKNTADHQTLIQLGVDIGIAAEETKQLLKSNMYSNEVNQDILEAHQIGVRGVPFFVLDRKYAISGAQESSVFLNALNELRKENESVSL